MAFPTIPDRQTMTKNTFVLKNASGNVCGQARVTNLGNDITITEEERLSDPTVFKARDQINATVDIEVYLQNSLKWLAVFMAGDTLNEATGWVGNEELEATVDSTPIDFTIEAYDNRTGSAVLQFVVHVINWSIRTERIPLGGTRGSVVATLNGNADRYYIVPAAG